MQHRQAGIPHFAARIPAEFLNFLRIRKSKAENQSQPEASGTWLWFVFGYFGCFMALPVQANIGKGLLQIFCSCNSPIISVIRNNFQKCPIDIDCFSACVDK